MDCSQVFIFFLVTICTGSGKLSDKYGRKPIIISGLIGYVIMQLLTGLATSLTMLYIARIFGGIFTSSVIPVSNAYLSDITSIERRTKIMAWSGVAISSGVIFDLVIGGFLSQTDFHIEYAMGQLHLDRFSVPFLFVAHKNITIHVARHGFATTVTQSNGVPIETVSKLLGHTQLRTTQIYGRVLQKKVGDDMQHLIS